MMRIAIAYYLGSEVFNKNRASNYRFNISQNYEKAFEWFSKCAKRGCSQSYFMLGWMCQHGQGTKEDVVSAKNYYQMSKEPEALIQISKLDNL